MTDVRPATRARSRDRRRGPLRQGLARAVLDRRQRLPDRAARRRHSAIGRSGRAGGERLRPGTACPITPRGGGTSQAGQSIGAGLVLDTSKHLNRILEINPDQKWARVEPGVVLDELNAALRPLNLRFAPDVSSASRATVGGMMANNSSGARSVLYGKTIDHVREQRVVLSDGTLAHFRPLDRGASWTPRGKATASRPARIAPFPRSAFDTRRRSSGAFRRSCAASAATTSMSSSTPSAPSISPASSSARKARSASSSRRSSAWCRCRRSKAVLTIEFDRPAGRARRRRRSSSSTARRRSR